jgi:hypothetical protein
MSESLHPRDLRPARREAWPPAQPHAQNGQYATLPGPEAGHDQNDEWP